MSKKKPQVKINGKQIFLRHPEPKDAEEFVSLSRSSVKFHKDLVNPALNVEEFTDFVKRNEDSSNECFLILRKEDEAILGVINISQIFLGGFKSAYLGYYLFEGFAGKRYMSDAMRAILRHAFSNLKLHRLEANIQPYNESSIRLVKNCGFIKEGFSRKYLKIGGEWRDHERWAIIKEDWKVLKKKK